MGKMIYKTHDGCLLRTGTPPFKVELYRPDQEDWIPFPQDWKDDVNKSSVVAWLEGNEISESEAKDLMRKQVAAAE